MVSTRMTRKGQVTIPAEIRESLGLQQGDTFIVWQEGNRIILENGLAAVDDLFGIFQDRIPAEERSHSLDERVARNREAFISEIAHEDVPEEPSH